jgi:hypothetical protein
MSKRQQYAVVPKPLLDKLIYAVEQESMAYADPIAHVDDAVTALEAWQAAPLPPEQVLSDEEIEDLRQQPESRRFDARSFARAIERAVLTRLTEIAA